MKKLGQKLKDADSNIESKFDALIAKLAEIKKDQTKQHIEIED